jgi:hypothetical protein
MLFLHTRDYIMPVPEPGAGLFSLICALWILHTFLSSFNHGYIEEALFWVHWWLAHLLGLGE